MSHKNIERVTKKYEKQSFDWVLKRDLNILALPNQKLRDAIIRDGVINLSNEDDKRFKENLKKLPHFINSLKKQFFGRFVGVPKEEFDNIIEKFRKAMTCVSDRNLKEAKEILKEVEKESMKYQKKVKH